MASILQALWLILCLRLIKLLSNKDKEGVQSSLPSIFIGSMTARFPPSSQSLHSLSPLPVPTCLCKEELCPQPSVLLHPHPKRYLLAHGFKCYSQGWQRAVPSTQLTAIYDFSFRESSAFFWPLWVPDTHTLWIFIHGSKTFTTIK